MSSPSPQDPRELWRVGSFLLMLNPFIGLGLILFDPPRWVEAVSVIVMVVFVAIGMTLLRRRTGGWRPSETLTQSHDQ